jgi:hypothetical protein
MSLILLIYFFNLFHTINNFYSIYGVNDDYLINTMLEGSYEGLPNANVTYMHNFLGHSIVFLYNIFPSLPVFSLLLLIFFLIAVIGTYIVALTLNQSRFFLVSGAWLLSSIFITNWYVLNPTFTAVSILLSSFGYFYIFSILKNKSKIQLLSFLLPTTLLLIGYMIRSRGFQSSTLVWFPAITTIVLYKVFNKNFLFLRRFNPKYLLLAFPVLLVTISNLFISQDWQNYYAYNNLRQEIVNTTRTVYIQQNIEKSGWNQDELLLFDNFSFADQRTFNKSQLEFLITFSNSSQSVQGFLNPVVSVEDRLLNLKRYNGLILTFLILPIGLLVISSRKNFSNYTFFVIVVGSTFFTLYYILATGKIEERVVIPVLLNIWFIIFALPSKSIKSFNIYKFTVFLVTLSIFLLNFQNHIHEPTYFKEKSKWNKRAIAFANQQQNFLENLGSDSIFVGPISYIRSSWTSPYKPVDQRGINFVSLGWHSFSPSWNSHNKGIFKNDLTVYENLLRNPKVFWISDPDSSEFFFNYLRKNYESKLSPSIVDSFGDASNDYGGIYNVYSLLIK